MERGRKLLQARTLHHWIERASINRLILLTQFSIFARKCTFSQSGSHIYFYYINNNYDTIIILNILHCTVVLYILSSLQIIILYNIIMYRAREIIMHNKYI